MGGKIPSSLAGSWIDFRICSTPPQPWADLKNDRYLNKLRVEVERKMSSMIWLLQVMDLYYLLYIWSRWTNHWVWCKLPTGWPHWDGFLCEWGFSAQTWGLYVHSPSRPLWYTQTIQPEYVYVHHANHSLNGEYTIWLYSIHSDKCPTNRPTLLW